MDKLWPDYTDITAELRDNVALITLARPASANALSSTTVRELADAIAVVANEASLRALVLTGSGDKIFCAGADLKERRENPGKDAQIRRPLVKFWNDLYRLDKPLVIGANGHAAGGGFELLMLADAVVISEHAQCWLPEIQWGGIPGGWGTQLLPRLVGPVRARWIVLGCGRLSSQEVLDMGLATHRVPQAQVLARALEVAHHLASQPAAAVACAKEALRNALSTALATGVEIEDRLLEIAASSPERQAGLARFAQGKRA
jgi:enoyl-CoA hydratase